MLLHGTDKPQQMTRFMEDAYAHVASCRLIPRAIGLAYVSRQPLASAADTGKFKTHSNIPMSSAKSMPRRNFGGGPLERAMDLRKIGLPINRVS